MAFPTQLYALVEVKPMVLSPAVSSLPSSYSMSQQHLTKMILGLFLKPFLSHLPGHSLSWFSLAVLSQSPLPDLLKMFLSSNY